MIMCRWTSSINLYIFIYFCVNCHNHSQEAAVSYLTNTSKPCLTELHKIIFKHLMSHALPYSSFQTERVVTLLKKSILRLLSLFYTTPAMEAISSQYTALPGPSCLLIYPLYTVPSLCTFFDPCMFGMFLLSRKVNALHCYKLFQVFIQKTQTTHWLVHIMQNNCSFFIFNVWKLNNDKTPWQGHLNKMHIGIPVSKNMTEAMH